MKILITGPDGFVGTQLVRSLSQEPFELVLASQKELGDFTPEMNWSKLLKGVEAVVHLAARVHIMNDTSTDPQKEYDFINFEVTQSLAKQAAQNGVKKFIFISTIKVNGEGKETPYTENDIPHPEDAYARSKYKAELALKELSKEYPQTSFVTIRPPLIYGRGVKANFLNLAKAVQKRLPLPLKNVEGKRSLLFVGNLIDAIKTILVAPQTKNATYLLSDGEDVTSGELVTKISKAMKISDLAFSLPKGSLKLLLTLIGKKGFYQRLTQPLCVDSSTFKNDYHWNPPFSLEQGLEKTFLPSYFSLKKRLFDLILSLIIALFFFIPFFVIALLVKLTSRGPVLHTSKRVGKDNTIFLMPKFRTMRIDTPQVATHLLTNPKAFLTPIGSFLRKTSLDELPQLLSIIKGDMSFVGPRPALFNQDDLIQLRTEKGVHQLIPGLTGWAQVNGRDEIPIPQKVALDHEYLEKQSFLFDIKIMWITFIKVIKSQDVSH